MGGKREKCSIMSDKVFFLRFKDHCATLNMFVTFFFFFLFFFSLTETLGTITRFTRTLSASAQGKGEGEARGEKKSIPIYLSQVPFKGNK